LNFNLALLTGATGGLGVALATLISQKNIPLILVGKDEKKLIDLQRLCPNSSYIVADLLHNRDRLIDVIREKKPDLIINNAGIGLYNKAALMSTKEQLDILEINAKALLEITLEGIKTLIKENRCGTILNVSSIGAEMPTPMMSVYGASKAFVTMFSKACDFECTPYKIRILVASPGQFSSSFATKAAKKSVDESKKIASMSSERVAKRILWQIEKGKGVDYFDWRYRCLRFLVKYILPDRLISYMIASSIDLRLK
jgi:uncharacterized protein